MFIYVCLLFLSSIFYVWNHIFRLFKVSQSVNHSNRAVKINILSVNEKLPLLKFRYFENYKKNLDFVFLVNYRHALRNKTVLIALQLGSRCCTCNLCFRGLSKCENIIFKNKHASVCLKDIP